MPLSRVGLVVLVVGTAIAGSYFSITNPLKLGEKTPAAAILGSSNEVKKPGNLLTSKAPLEIAEEGPAQPAQKGFFASAGASNLTNQITETISNFLIGRITEKNSEGPIVQDGKSNIAVPSEDEINKLIEEQIGGPSSAGKEEDAYHPKVLEAKLKVTNNASKSAQIDYVNSLIRIVKKHSEASRTNDAQAISDFLEKKNTGTARELANMYGKIAVEYTTIAIPANWNTLHKQVLSYYFTAESMWQDIANYEQDPAQAAITVRELPMLQQAGLGITELIWREMQKNRISFDELTM